MQFLMHFNWLIRWNVTCPVPAFITTLALRSHTFQLYFLNFKKHARQPKLQGFSHTLGMTWWPMRNLVDSFQYLKRAHTLEISVKVSTLANAQRSNLTLQTDISTSSQQIDVCDSHFKRCILIHRYSTCKSALIHTWLHPCLSFSLAHQRGHCRRLLTESVIVARSPSETAISDMLWLH